MIVQSVHNTNIVVYIVDISVGGDEIACVCVYVYLDIRISLWTLSLIPSPPLSPPHTHIHTHTLASLVGPSIQAWRHINHHLCIKRSKLVQS